MSLALQLVNENKPILFISTVKPFSTTRLNQLIENSTYYEYNSLFEKCTRMFHTVEIKDITNFKIYLEKDIIPETHNKKICAIFIDSIIGLLDVEFINNNNGIDLITRNLYIQT